MYQQYGVSSDGHIGPGIDLSLAPRLLVRLLETRLVEVLRFQRGQVAWPLFPLNVSIEIIGKDKSPALQKSPDIYIVYLMWWDFQGRIRAA